MSRPAGWTAWRQASRRAVDLGPAHEDQVPRRQGVVIGYGESRRISGREAEIVSQLAGREAQGTDGVVTVIVVRWSPILLSLLTLGVGIALTVAGIKGLALD